MKMLMRTKFDNDFAEWDLMYVAVSSGKNSNFFFPWKLEKRRQVENIVRESVCLEYKPFKKSHKSIILLLKGLF